MSDICIQLHPCADVNVGCGVQYLKEQKCSLLTLALNGLKIQFSRKIAVSFSLVLLMYAVCTFFISFQYKITVAGRAFGTWAFSKDLPNLIHLLIPP